MLNHKLVMMIGTNKKGENYPTWLIDETYTIIDHEMVRHGFSDYTTYECTGHYTYKNGIRTKEKTIKVEVFSNKKIRKSLVKNLVDQLKDELDQESILVQIDKKKYFM